MNEMATNLLSILSIPPSSFTKFYSFFLTHSVIHVILDAMYDDEKDDFYFSLHCFRSTYVVTFGNE